MGEHQNIIEALSNLGVDVEGSRYGDCLDERVKEEYLKETLGYLKGYDFMKLGQAVNRGRWEGAYMTLRRMERQAGELGFRCLERNIMGLKQAVRQKNTAEAKQILAAMTSKRVQLLKLFQDQYNDAG